MTLTLTITTPSPLSFFCLNSNAYDVGINQGPITAGVIGVKKPHFDMWGNTVNVASRMESTGRAGSIQVVEETATILRHFGFQFDQRGLVSVKGKGKLMTFYLTGRSASTAGVTVNCTGGGGGGSSSNNNNNGASANPVSKSPSSGGLITTIRLSPLLNDL